MKTLRDGERVWQAFVHVSLVQVMPEVRPLRVVRRVSDEQVHVYDERSGHTRLIEECDVGSVYCETEHEAWGACESALRRIAHRCLDCAESCSTRKEVVRVVA